MEWSGEYDSVVFGSKEARAIYGKANLVGPIEEEHSYAKTIWASVCTAAMLLGKLPEYEQDKWRVTADALARREIKVSGERQQISTYRKALVSPKGPFGYLECCRPVGAAELYTQLVFDCVLISGAQYSDIGDLKDRHRFIHRDS